MAKVKCSACGEKKFVNPQALIARVAKFGSIEEIEKKWICSSCAANNKPAKESKTKIKKEQTKVATTSVEEYEEPVIEVGNDEELEEMLAKQ